MFLIFSFLDYSDLSSFFQAMFCPYCGQDLGTCGSCGFNVHFLAEYADDSKWTHIQFVNNIDVVHTTSSCIIFDF